MVNGKKGDNPLTDITLYQIPTFSPTADHLIAEIVRLGGKAKLDREFNLFAPPPLQDFEAALNIIRDRLYREAKERGWEV